MKATCSVSDCDRPVVARGWCRRHYNRWHLHGDPLGGGPDRPRKAVTVPRGATPGERFWAKVEKTDGCWTWTAALDEKGYGSFHVDGRTWRAHRFAWVLDGRELVDGMELDHLCRNRACVRVDHLDQVTGHENILRSENMAALNARKTHCPQDHEYTPENTYLWQGWRICRTCRSERATA